MEHLSKIFGSSHRVKIMRLFLFNEGTSFEINEIIQRSLVSRVDVRREINLLTKVGFLKKKNITKKLTKKKDKKKVSVWSLNHGFSLLAPLRTLIESELIDEKLFIKRIRKTGSIKLIILSGLFLNDQDRKIDLLIVGNKLNKKLLDSEIIKIESEIGQELSYAIFDVGEFQYRLDMNDKLIRDVMENHNTILINKLN